MICAWVLEIEIATETSQGALERDDSLSNETRMMNSEKHVVLRDMTEHIEFGLKQQPFP